MCNEDLLYKWFGVDAELLIDHAWGREPVTIADIKSYESKSKSLSSSQVLMRDYRYEEAEVIVKEMMDQLCLDMAAQKYVTDCVSIFVGYSLSQGAFGAGGSVRLTRLFFSVKENVDHSSSKGVETMKVSPGFILLISV